MKLNKGLLGVSILLTSFISHSGWGANVCQSTETSADKISRLKYYVAHLTCAPGTTVKYISPVRFGEEGKQLPCFQMVYKANPAHPDNPEADLATPERCDPNDLTDGPGGTCKSMLQDDRASFKVTDLEKQTDLPDDDSNSLKSKIYKWLRVPVTVGSKVASYGGVIVPFGDGVSGFLSDVSGQLNQIMDDKKKAADAAKAMGIVFQHMLGSAPVEGAPAGLTTACNDDTKASYTNGNGLTVGLSSVFTKLALEKNVDMGTNDNADISPAEAQLMAAQITGASNVKKLDAPTLSHTKQVVSEGQLIPWNFDQSALKTVPTTVSGTVGAPVSAGTAGVGP